MRYSLSILAIFCAQGLGAETIEVDSKVTEVTMHPDSAAIIRQAAVQLSEGRHRLVFRNVPDTALSDSLRIDVTGARQIGTVLRENYVPPYDPTSPEVRAAEMRIEEIEMRIQAVRDAAHKARLAGSAAEASIEFLRRLGDNEGLAETGPDTLRDIARMIREEAGTASQVALDAEIEARGIERQLKDLNVELAEARRALEALSVEDERRLFIAVDVDVAEAAEGEVRLSYLVPGVTFWTPAYDFRFRTEDTPRLVIDRNALVRQTTGENWTDVTLHLSTLEPVGQTEPNALQPWRRRIEPPAPPVPAPKASRTAGFALDGLSEPVIEAEIAEESAARWQISDGPGVTYTYAQPVSVASSADILRLELDSLNEDAEEWALAVPYYDETAYHMARVTNTSGEELLPSEFASRYIDGMLVGTGAFDGLVAGQELEMGFGPIDGLRLTRDVLDQSEGDRGLISRSNQRIEQIEIEVENLTDRSWPLRVLDRVAYSEQEDLEISWSASPSPSEENVDKKRGILAWDLEITPGQSERIRLNTTLDWPDGMVLR